MRVEKKDWLIAIGIAIIVTGFVIYTNYYNILFYLISFLIVIIAVCSFLIDWKPIHEHSRYGRHEWTVAWYKRENIRIVISLLLGSIVFFYLGMSASPNVYRAILPVVIILAPLVMFAMILFTIWSIRFVLRRRK